MPYNLLKLFQISITLLFYCMTAPQLHFNILIHIQCFAIFAFHIWWIFVSPIFGRRTLTFLFFFNWTICSQSTDQGHFVSTDFREICIFRRMDIRWMVQLIRWPQDKSFEYSEQLNSVIFIFWTQFTFLYVLFNMLAQT